LITGLIIREVMLRAIPVNIIVLTPFSKNSPENTREIRYKVTELTIKYLIALLTIPV